MPEIIDDHFEMTIYHKALSTFSESEKLKCASSEMLNYSQMSSSSGMSSIGDRMGSEMGTTSQQRTQF